GLPLVADKDEVKTPLMCLNHYGDLRLSQVNVEDATRPVASRRVNCCFIPALDLTNARPRLLLVAHLLTSRRMSSF
ncbi:hypothetical protein WJX84_003762, partial [Apatococcus fuscideae]